MKIIDPSSGVEASREAIDRYGKSGNIGNLYMTFANDSTFWFFKPWVGQEAIEPKPNEVALYGVVPFSGEFVTRRLLITNADLKAVKKYL